MIMSKQLNKLVICVEQYSVLIEMIKEEAVLIYYQPYAVA
jgi:hypothetical protein